MTINTKDRKRLIQKLRPYLTDQVIGNLFGISRERVAQVGGRRKNINVHRNTGSQYDPMIRKLALQGYTAWESQKALRDQGFDVPFVIIHSRRIALGFDLEHLKRLHQLRRMANIENRLREFIKTGRPFKMSQIAKWDYNLAALLERYLPDPRSRQPAYAQWAKKLGVKWDGYTFFINKEGKRTRQIWSD